jgi:RNA polymerase sigma-70 factor (ECF subfamily)
MDDAALLTATASGDAEAFAAFYRRHLPRVLAAMMRATGSRELAADLTAEVFAAALESAGRYVAVHASAEPWLAGIARNKLLDSLRRGRVQDATRRRLGLQPVPLYDQDLERVDQLVAAGAGAALELLDTLPPLERSAVQARVLDGWEYAEIASALACSQSVVRQRVSRGLRRLRRRLIAASNVGDGTL